MTVAKDTWQSGPTPDELVGQPTGRSYSTRVQRP
jgi:hypothetical protein